MNTYKFPKTINGMDGLPIGDSNGAYNFHHFLGNALASTDDQKSGIDCIKIMDWAQSIYKKGEVTLDQSDRLSFENWLKTMSGFSVLIKNVFLESLKK